MSAEIKICGLTRPEDAACAVRLGVRYAGVIFAGGPRSLSLDRAARVLAEVAGHVRRVGVFGAAETDDIAERAGVLDLDVVQLHGDPRPDEIDALRRRFGGEIWGVARVAGALLPDGTAELFTRADAVVLDARVADGLGGSGRAFDWEAVADALAPVRRDRRLVLAGGLTVENVAMAVRLLRPDVLDVSSGVERAPGIKDHEKMRGFVAAASGVPEAA